jgi:hypothetical protein
MQQHVCTSMYLTLLLILFIENHFSRLKCSQNCGNKSNSPIFKMMQVLGCYNWIGSGPWWTLLLQLSTKARWLLAIICSNSAEVGCRGWDDGGSTLSQLLQPEQSWRGICSYGKPVSIDSVGRSLTNYISMSKRLYPTIKVPNLDKRNIRVWDKDLLTR